MTPTILRIHVILRERERERERERGRERKRERERERERVACMALTTALKAHWEACFCCSLLGPKAM